MNIRFPQITAATEAEQLSQVKSFLHQLVEQLNVALVMVGDSAKSTEATSAKTYSAAARETEAQSTFNSIKALIIKSADIVNAYYDSISAKLEGVYVAQSDFGTYTEETSQLIQGNSDSIETLYTNIQTILSDIEGINSSIIEVNAHINTGVLYYDADTGAPVYGLEIGQRTEVDGEEVFDKYAQFTSDKLSFFDNNGIEVAYISDQKLFITHVEIKGSLVQGGYVDTVLADGGIVTKWVGIGG